MTMFMSCEETAKELGVTKRTLRNWRYKGTGPPYRFFGRRVMYETEDVIGWMKSQRKVTTTP